MASSNELTEPVAKLIGGILWILGAFWLTLSIAGNPLDELALIRRAQIAPSSLIDNCEDEQEDERGRVYFSDVGVYAYSLPDGREFKTIARRPTGQLNQLEDVEYLPDNPAVSRIKGDGCRSVFEFVWRKIGFGWLLLLIFSGIEILMLRNAIRDIKKLRTTVPGSAPERN